MKKKKLLPLVALLVVLIVLGIFSSKLLSTRGKSNQRLDDFLVADTAAVDRIVITQSNGFSIDLKRTNGIFTTATGDCIQEEMIFNILHTFTKVAVKSYIPENSIENIKKSIRINYRKVEIYKNGDLEKTWWIGTSTPDLYGTYALLETPENGISSEPVVLEMRGLNGSIESRFTADPRTWVCSDIFRIPIEDIQQVSVQNNDDKSSSFSIIRTGKGRSFKALDANNQTILYDTLKMVRYLDQFKKINFESSNYSLSEKQVDSVKATKPYIVVKVKMTSGKEKIIKTYRIPGTPGDTDAQGNQFEWDPNKLWAALNDGRLVKIQYFVFDPIFSGKTFFEVGSRKTYPGWNE